MADSRLLPGIEDVLPRGIGILGSVLACPRCGVQLRIVRSRRGAAHRCPRCKGHALTYPVVREALERGRWKRLWRRIFTSDDATGIVCPGCDKPMAQVRDGDLVIDSCRTCYLLWFDPGELQQVRGRPLPGRVSPAAAEAAARLEIARAARTSESAGAPENAWQLICGWLGLPYELDGPLVQHAWVTLLLALGLVGVHLGATLAGLREVIAEWGFVPALMDRHGGATWITCFFLHGGWLHLLSNAYFLITFGDNVEQELGAARYVLLLVLGSLCGCLLHAWFDPRSEVPLVGASAGISAVLLYYAFRFPKARIGWALRYWVVPIWWFRMTARTAFGLWIALQFVLAWFQKQGLTSVSAAGHLGGVAAGILFVVAQRTSAEGDR